MIVIPEKIALIKVPKAASTTIARMFWDVYDINRYGRLKADVATNIRHFMPLTRVGQKIPVLNGNWFLNRSRPFGWHASHADLSFLFGDQLADFHWLTSVRHPVSRLFSVFSFQIAKGRISASLCAADFEKFCNMVFSDSTLLSHQQVIHTWPQSFWLPPEDSSVRLTIIRHERLAEDIRKLAPFVPTFAAANVGYEGRSFSGQWQQYISPDLQHRIEAFYAEDMRRFGYTPLIAKECGVAK